MTDLRADKNANPSDWPAVSSEGPWKRLRYMAEASGAHLAFVFFRMLPVGAASAIAGRALQTFGPLASAHRIADRNIRAALPELTEMERRAVLRGMWNNIGRVFGEYAHLGRLAGDPIRVEIVDPGNLYARAVSSGTGALALSAHFGNWELFCLPACRSGGRLSAIYRAANNPYVDRLLKRSRHQMGPIGLIPKGAGAIRKAVSQLRKGQHVGMVVDQKTNEGIPVEFFGRDAMTTRSPAALAYRFECPVFVILVERVTGANFRIVVHEVTLARSGNYASDVEQTTRSINAIIEAAIRARPELWMWAHRRWPA